MFGLSNNNVGVPVKILQELLHSSILATCTAHLNILDLIILTTLGMRMGSGGQYQNGL
jgi:hypothetical protein